MISKRKQIWMISITTLLVIYLFFFPNPTAELAVRKHLFFSLHPIKALSVHVKETGSTSFGGAKLFYVDEVSKSFIWVKKNWLGYRVITDGTGP
ncbi:hypothetical protein [Paenibacillus sp. LjRoot56]|uniref:hypothetical protein n=1 Tax=Paenibacillus sp. LjRoot56 TaxID=3342333 RepID=UPI003ECD100D